MMRRFCRFHGCGGACGGLSGGGDKGSSGGGWPRCGGSACGAGALCGGSSGRRRWRLLSAQRWLVPHIAFAGAIGPKAAWRSVIIAILRSARLGWGTSGGETSGGGRSRHGGGGAGLSGGSRRAGCGRGLHGGRVDSLELGIPLCFCLLLPLLSRLERVL